MTFFDSCAFDESTLEPLLRHRRSDARIVERREKVISKSGDEATLFHRLDADHFGGSGTRAPRDDDHAIA